MDPLLTLSCGTAVPHDENGHGEYEAAGSWAGRPVDLVKCETSDLMVPANAEIVLEGEVVPYERVNDGPHGESTGFYNQYTSTFMVKIKAITHRKDPISFGLICGRIEDYPRPLMRSNTLLDVLIAKSGLTNIKEVFFPDAGRSGFLIIRAQITSPEQPKQIIDAAYEHMRYRWVIVVDEDCNVRDWNDVLWRIVSSVVAGPRHVPRPRVRVQGSRPRRGRVHPADLRHGVRRHLPIQGVRAPAVPAWRNPA